MRTKTLPSKSDIESLYTNELLPMHEVADRLNCSVGLIHKLVHLYHIQVHRIIPPKSVEECERISKLHKGKKLSEETKAKISESRSLKRSGHRKLGNDGYIKVYYPTHPNATKDGYVMEHHLVMEKQIGRCIRKDEVVHHKNHIRNDNRIENLELMTFKEHSSLHMRERHEKRRER